MCAIPFRTDKAPPISGLSSPDQTCRSCRHLALRCRGPPLSPHRSEYRCRESLQAMKQLLLKREELARRRDQAWRWWLFVGHTRPQQDCCLLCGVIGSCADRIGSPNRPRLWERERRRRRGGSGADVKPERSAGAEASCLEEGGLDELLQCVEVAATLVLGAVSGLAGLPVLDGRVAADALLRAEVTLDLQAAARGDREAQPLVGRRPACMAQARGYGCERTVQSTSPTTTVAWPSYSPASWSHAGFMRLQWPHLRAHNRAPGEMAPGAIPSPPPARPAAPQAPALPPPMPANTVPPRPAKQCPCRDTCG